GRGERGDGLASLLAADQSAGLDAGSGELADEPRAERAGRADDEDGGLGHLGHLQWAEIEAPASRTRWITVAVWITRPRAARPEGSAGASPHRCAADGRAAWRRCPWACRSPLRPSGNRWP